jgi:hypothetical protein
MLEAKKYRQYAKDCVRIARNHLGLAADLDDRSWSRTMSRA